MTELRKKKTPRDLLRVVFRRRYLFLLGTSFFAIGALLWGYYLPLEYKGVAMFQRWEDETDVAADSAIGKWSEDDKKTLNFQLAGFPAMERAAEELELVTGPRDETGKLTAEGKRKKQELVNELLKGVRVQFAVRSENKDYIQVSFVHKDPRIAEIMPNRLVKNYMDNYAVRKIAELTKSKEYLVQQDEQARQDLNDELDRKRAFEKDHLGAMFPSPTSIQNHILSIEAKIESLRGQERMVADNIPELEKTVEDWERVQTGTTRPAIEKLIPNEERKALLKQLDDMRERLAIALESMKEAHPSIINFRKAIERLEKKIAKMPEMVPIEVEVKPEEIPDRRKELMQARMELKAIRDKIARGSAEIQRLEGAMADFGATSKEYALILERVNNKQRTIVQYRDRRREVESALKAELLNKRTRMEALLLAQPQSRPSSPSMLRILLVTILGGLGFGAALVLVANIMDRSISTPEDASKNFPIPVHGVIGEIITVRRRARRALGRWLIVPVLFVLVGGCLGGFFFNIYLHLQKPAEHEKWIAHPVTYVVDEVTQKVRNLID